MGWNRWDKIGYWVDVDVSKCMQMYANVNAFQRIQKDSNGISALETPLLSEVSRQISPAQPNQPDPFPG